MEVRDASMLGWVGANEWLWLDDIGIIIYFDSRLMVE